MPRSEDTRRRLAFLELGDDDRRNLTKLRPLLEKHADSFVSAFYRHLLSFEATRSLLMDPEVERRLLNKQREYLLSLADPELTPEYLEQRLAIGRTHLRVGLEPRWYLSAYALYLRLLIPAILDHWRQEPAVAEQIIVSLHKVLMLDAQLAMESYIARRVRASEDLASMATIVAGLAHEIGTPMSVIQGHAELLESSVKDEAGRRRLTTIREQIDRIAQIVQTVLNMARPARGEPMPVELVGLARETLAFLAEKLRARAITPRISAAEPVTLVGDHDKLEQTLINLVLNAVDAMPRGGTVEIAVERQGAHAELRVSDSGDGMSEEVAARVFDPFFTTKPTGRGNGLGLAVVRGIVADHGGSIRVTSAPGRGTTFTIELPLVEA